MKKDWLEWEEKYLSAQYGLEPAAHIAQYLGRSTKSVVRKAQRMGLQFRRYRHWTVAEELKLCRGETPAERTSAEIRSKKYNLRKRIERLRDLI